MYAGDTTLLYIVLIHSIHETNRHIVINNELEDISWLASNTLSLC